MFLLIRTCWLRVEWAIALCKSESRCWDIDSNFRSSKSYTSCGGSRSWGCRFIQATPPWHSPCSTEPNAIVNSWNSVLIMYQICHNSFCSTTFNLPQVCFSHTFIPAIDFQIAHIQQTATDRLSDNATTAMLQRSTNAFLSVSPRRTIDIHKY